MGGRGTYAADNYVPFTYETVDIIEGVKVLEGLDGKHSLPEEAHSSRAYIKLKRDGSFHQIRIYDSNKYLRLEIAYHPEPNLDLSRKNILHYHIYDEFFNRSPAIAIKKKSRLYQRYQKYFRGGCHD